MNCDKCGSQMVALFTSFECRACLENLPSERKFLSGLLSHFLLENISHFHENSQIVAEVYTADTFPPGNDVTIKLASAPTILVGGVANITEIPLIEISFDIGKGHKEVYPIEESNVLDSWKRVADLVRERL